MSENYVELRPTVATNDANSATLAGAAADDVLDEHEHDPQHAFEWPEALRIALVPWPPPPSGFAFGSRFLLRSADVCYHLWEYTRRGEFSASPTNNLISNSRKSPRRS